MPENLFEKVDRQSEKIDLVAGKLEGVSIEELYALAKRTWDYNDYDMAQKYYNHISLLQPLEWKAPYCASLCGCMGPIQIGLWDRRPKTAYSYYASTVDYIQSRTLPQAEQEQAVLQATDIVLSVFREYIDIYLIPENRKSFDECAPEFKRELQKAFICVIKKLDAFESDLFQEKQKEACHVLGDFLEKYCQADQSIVVTKEDFEKYIQPLYPHIQYDENLFSEPDPNRIAEIKLKGRCYLEYKDKVIAERRAKKNLIFAILLFAATLTTTMIPMIKGGRFMWLALLSVVLVPFTVLFLLRSIGNRKGIRQNGWLYPSRWKFRKNSDGNVVCERNPVWVGSVARVILYWFSPMLAIGLIGNTWSANFAVLESVLLTISYAVQAVALIVFASEDINDYNCFRRFEYQGKTYRFK